MSVSSDSEEEGEHLISEVEETVDVEGFLVHVSKENQVKELFKDHPDLDSNFNVQNQELKTAYMDVILKLIETLFHSTNVLSWNQLNKADTTLFDLTKAGFKVDWLRQRLDESYLKREKLDVSEARVKELERIVKKRKLNLSDLESDLKKEKAAVAVAAEVASASAAKAATASATKAAYASAAAYASKGPAASASAVKAASTTARISISKVVK